jgi:hypothetical protein
LFDEAIDKSHQVGRKNVERSNTRENDIRGDIEEITENLYPSKRETLDESKSPPPGK